MVKLIMKNSDLISKSKEVIDEFIIPNNIYSIIVCGSVGKGISDEYSDLEIKIIWKEAPSKEERSKLFSKLSFKNLYDEYFEDIEWYSSIILDSGLKIDFSHCTLQTVEKIINDVQFSFDSSIDLQTFISSIIYSIDLYGDTSEYRNKLQQYPDALAKKCIEVNLIFESWSMREILIHREDYLALSDVINQNIFQLLRLLFALNKKYLISDRFKWLDFQLDLLEIKPRNLKEVILNCVKDNKNKDFLNEINDKIIETFELVQEKYPDIDLEESYRALNYIKG